MNEINLPNKKGKKGGGLFGKILGAAAGGAAAALTGGAAVPAIGLGMGLGEAAGQVAKPGKASQQRPGVAMSRVAEKDPQIQFQKLRQAQADLVKEPSVTPEQRDQYMSVLEQGKLELKKRWQ